ncbi:hypothetical protein X802_08130 [Thermococcus guaymasensis DSM 11113]|uniref:DUF1097 domain-containing protein n=1 Tax=Thermococcus guaymasensis DSM 11113 TaxID=1432656 RepID=A0A0X1KLJ7_9EURY|nr:hypothetical protein [Thermococcus guaymasensis]AJC72128.1 hypothetical protein X802_08130 [Thermococcus guaymasensis DSM 11113]
MKVEKLFKAVTGAGVGSLVAFLLAITTLPEDIDVYLVMGMYTASMLIFALIFSKKEWQFKTSSLSYVSGMVIVAIAQMLSIYTGIGGGVVFFLVALSLFFILYSKPGGVFDVVLAGPLYFSGAMTVFVLESALGIPAEQGEVWIVAIFVGFLGMMGALTGAAARLLLAKPKP